MVGGWQRTVLSYRLIAMPPKTGYVKYISFAKNWQAVFFNYLALTIWSSLLRLKTGRLQYSSLRVGVEHLQCLEILHTSLFDAFRITVGARFLEFLKSISHALLVVRVKRIFSIAIFTSDVLFLWCKFSPAQKIREKHTFLRYTYKNGILSGSVIFPTSG